MSRTRVHLNEQESLIALAAVQTIERGLADRLEERAEPGTGHLPQELRGVFDEHDRVTHLVRKLQTAGYHDLFDWEVEIVRESLRRYRSVLNDPSHAEHMADENSRFIVDEEQREESLRHSAALLDRLPSKH
jgi:hypothetical protein